MRGDEKEVSRVLRVTNVLTEMYFRQVIGRFVRMQEKPSIHDKEDKCGANIAFSSAQSELIKRIGGRVDQATVAQLAHSIALQEKWRDVGLDAVELNRMP